MKYYDRYKGLSVADLLYQLEDDNYHTEETLLEALAHKDYNLIVKVCKIIIEQDKEGSLTPELAKDRDSIDKELRSRWLPSEWEVFRKIEKDCRLEDLNATAQNQFDTELTDEELEQAFNRFEHLYDCEQTENDCLYEAVNSVVSNRA